MKKAKSLVKYIISIVSKLLYAIKIKYLLNSIEVEKENPQKIIAFHTVRYTRLYHEGLFAKIFARRGYKVYMVLDDGLLPHWDSIRFKKGDSSKALTPLREKGLRYIFNNIVSKINLWTYSDKNIEYIRYSDIQDKVALDSAKEVDLEYYARTSTIRFYENTALDFTEPGVKNYFRYSLSVAEHSLKAGKYIKEFIGPDYFINNLGIYACMGPCNEYLRKEGYNTKIYCRSAYRDYHLIIDREKAQLLSRSDKWNSSKHETLSEEQRGKADEFLTARMSHETSDTQIYFQNSGSTIDFELNDNSRTTFGAFPNVVWDGDERERNVIFDDVVDWITELINHFSKNYTNNLVIRFHPSEATYFTNSKKLETIIREKFPDIDSHENIQLIPSKSSIDTYKLIKKKVDIGMVYDGMLGLELPSLGKPVLIAGKGAIDKDYIMNGITVDSREDYFKVLESPDLLIEKFKEDEEEWKNRSLKYIYWYVFKNTFYSPSANKLGKGFEDFSLSHFTKEEFSPQKNEQFIETLNEFLK